MFVGFVGFGIYVGGEAEGKVKGLLCCRMGSGEECWGGCWWGFVGVTMEKVMSKCTKAQEWVNTEWESGNVLV